MRAKVAKLLRRWAKVTGHDYQTAKEVFMEATPKEREALSREIEKQIESHITESLQQSQ